MKSLLLGSYNVTNEMKSIRWGGGRGLGTHPTLALIDYFGTYAITNIGLLWLKTENQSKNNIPREAKLKTCIGKEKPLII